MLWHHLREPVDALWTLRIGGGKHLHHGVVKQQLGRVTIEHVADVLGQRPADHLQHVDEEMDVLYDEWPKMAIFCRDICAEIEELKILAKLEAYTLKYKRHVP